MDKYGRDPRDRDQYELETRGGRERQYDMGDGQGAVTRQPSAMGYSSGARHGLPRGLEYLTQVDQLLIQQQMELCEILSGCETNNKYLVSNSMGQQVYSALEETNWCTRQCCGPIRPFDMQLQDGSERQVLQLRRPLRCQGCCCPCCLQELEVLSADGQPLGSIRERWTFIKPKLTVHAADGRHVFTIRGPICKCSCGGDVLFRVLTADDEQEVGAIRKQWSGALREFVTDSDTFSVTFPVDLDVSLKATLLGALFLLDFMFFEHSK